ncbi:thyrotropin-releasing hormone receptor-like [Lingula anatina]|uniref:Thyrotropin-releasing hormone receptor n=1 Tax=Lingula anatina TaxID=7574 RepID=A0A1S3J0E7_LINAN|nr:thyrotropin-releasing hormone receptor-like [Lingula anatina]|eukprot:XP_013403733.1 thyrotropin-releasing hormone receptor-like [Lingula anatina]
MAQSPSGLPPQSSMDQGSFLNGTESDWNNNISLCVSNESVTNVTLPFYYPLPYVIISVIMGVIIFTVGFLGNLLVIVVVARTKTMHSTTNCYLVSLALADCLVLISATLPHTVGMFWAANHFPYGTVCCALLTFLNYLGINASALSITAFTIERYIAICHPMKAHAMCTVSRAKKLIIGLWIFSIFYNSPWFGLTEIQVPTGDSSVLQVCTFKLDRGRYAAYYFVDLVLFYIIPLAVTAVLYCLIGRILFLSTNRGLAADSIKRNTMKERVNKDRTSFKQDMTRSRIQVLKMLIVVVVLFALLWLPYRALVVYNSVAAVRFDSIWFLMFCRHLISVNSAINPIIYNIMSTKFREAFRKACIACYGCCAPNTTGTTLLQHTTCMTSL